MGHEAESASARAKRVRRRALFDAVAERYDAARPSWTAAAVDHLLAAAELEGGSRVLEVGCGTGQLTAQLAGRGLLVTAIDLGRAMVAGARRRVGDPAVSFRPTSFEDLVAVDGSFDLVVAADAFHWIDPTVRFSKASRLLRPEGWLAVLSLEQQYEEPLRSALKEMWIARSEECDRWCTADVPTVAEEIAASGWFREPAERVFATQLTMRPSAVVALESTRATALSWSPAARRAFTEELLHHVGSDRVGLTRVASVTMAQRLVPMR